MYQPLLFPDAPTLAEAYALRDAGIATVAANAGGDFAERARAFVLEYLRGREATGEDVTDAGTEAGIVAPNGPKAWGPVIQSLSRAGLIVKAGFGGPRRKGHASGVCIMWRKV